MMVSDTTTNATVIRTERGLTIAGTRITLYDVMDYLTAGWPAKLIRGRLNLSDQQMADVLAYICDWSPCRMSVCRWTVVIGNYGASPKRSKWSYRRAIAE